MGSWYQTCGLSKLPIHLDNRIVVFILKQNDELLNSTGFSGDGFLYF